MHCVSYDWIENFIIFGEFKSVLNYLEKSILLSVFLFSNR